MNTQPVIGISGCLTGSAVRFDGGHKRMGFVMDELAQWVAFKPVCPEMAIGLPVPRPALRLVQTPVGEIRMRFSHAPHEDVTEKIKAVVEKAALAVGADAWSRIDVMLRDDGSFVLLEINTAPGMTPHSLVPLAARTSGISYEELVKQVAARASLKG